ncbi:hypothetical protein [Wenzhouxiangella sp. EGI_FJ10305]|uniref:hypothetical protein n=1 Tax=Wenzhouxiangella sp. EGI_FJ10305 TaxID=3243768 RepID=UPI0035D52DB8
MNIVTNSRKALLAGIAMTACLGFTFNAQAQDCVISNWQVDGAPTASGLSDADAGKQEGDNRRYGGPCGLRVDVDGTERYVTDGSPGGETNYIARFYVFLDDATPSGPVVLFAANDGTDDQIQVQYDGGDLSLHVWDSGETEHTLDVAGAGSGWHSIEFVWEQAADAQIAFIVDGADDVTPSSTIDTSGMTIENAFLGNVNGQSGSGWIDFDDFDSRRVERPGRLMVGDADASGSLTISDLFAVNNELAPGGDFAAGQPDCDENGSMTIGDLFCVNNLL